MYHALKRSSFILCSCHCNTGSFPSTLSPAPCPQHLVPSILAPTPCPQHLVPEILSPASHPLHYPIPSCCFPPCLERLPIPLSHTSAWKPCPFLHCLAVKPFLFCTVSLAPKYSLLTCTTRSLTSFHSPCPEHYLSSLFAPGPFSHAFREIFCHLSVCSALK